MRWSITAARLARGAAIMAVALGGWPAHAVPLLFDFSSTLGNRLSFVLDSNPTPFAYSPGAFTALAPGTPLYDGNPPSGPTGSVSFGVSGYPAQFGYDDPSTGVSYFYAGASQIYSGGEDAPVFTVGTYALADISGGAPASLSVQSAPGGPGAPAPLIGVGLLPALGAGAALRLTRRRKVCLLD